MLAPMVKLSFQTPMEMNMLLGNLIAPRDSSPKASTKSYSIFSVTCEDGSIQAGIIGVSKFEFGTSGNALYAQDPSSIQKRSLLSIIEIFELIELVAFLLEFRSDLGIDDPRCSNPDLDPVVKFGARDPESNGCGSPPFTYNYPPFAAAGCCDAHDFCYGETKSTSPYPAS
jgi:hypothetical protein